MNFELLKDDLNLFQQMNKKNKPTNCIIMWSIDIRVAHFAVFFGGGDPQVEF